MPFTQIVHLQISLHRPYVEKMRNLETEISDLYKHLPRLMKVDFVDSTGSKKEVCDLCMAYCRRKGPVSGVYKMYLLVLLECSTNPRIPGLFEKDDQVRDVCLAPFWIQKQQQKANVCFALWWRKNEGSLDAWAASKNCDHTGMSVAST
jgi:hypothetical protein